MPSFKTLYRGGLAALLVLYSFGLGVWNERYFPGDHYEPLPGELKYWVGLAALMIFASMLVPEQEPALSNTKQNKD